MARLSIHLLGPFQVLLDGEPASGFVSDKARALLAYLAVEGREPHRREKLAALLWPDSPESSARTNLRNALSNVRKVIGDRAAPSPFLRCTRQTIQMNPGSDLWTDVAAFTELLTGDPLPGEEAICQLEQAVQLYRGAFLEGFSLPDSIIFGDWALWEQERLHRLVMDVLLRLGAWYEAQGRPEPALKHARRRIQLEPWQESSHQQVMRLLATSGRRAEALAQYRSCVRQLADELGVGPSSETEALYQRIQDAEDETPLPAAAAAPKLRNNLPASLSAFVGRRDELARIGVLLQDPGCRLLTLVGPGGIGKTRLALEAATAQLDNGWEGVFQVRLAGVDSAKAMVPAIAQAVGFAFYRGEDPQQQLLSYLKPKRLLLLVDNLEHLLDGVRLLVDILQAAPGVTILATSRTRLNLQGEYLFAVDGLSCPEAEPSGTAAGGVEEAQDPAAWDAVTLFATGARRVSLDFDLRRCLPDVVRICQAVQGMPLAILLASAWVEVLPPAEVARQIEQDLDFLAASWQDVPERHRSVRAAFDHSWRLLAGRERAIFQALSVFRGGFDYRAAQVVADAGLHDLRSLVDKSLLLCSPAGRYEVHELLRSYAAQQLASEPAADEATRDRHAAHYAAALAHWAGGLHGPRQEAVLAEMDPEVGSLRAAWDRAVGRAHVGWLDQALDSYCLYLYRRVLLQEGEAACREAAEKLAGLVSEAGLRVRAKTMAWQSLFAWQVGRPDAAVQLLQQSMLLLQEPCLDGLDTRSERALILLRMGQILAGFDRESAAALLDESLQLNRELANHSGAATAMHALGWIAWHAGDPAEASVLREESLAIRRELGAPRAIAESLSALASGAQFQGDLERAARLVAECVDIRRQIGDAFSIAWSLADLGGLSLWSGRFDEASAQYRECIELWRSLGIDTAVYDVSLAGAELMRGNYACADGWARTGLATARANGDERATGIARLVLGSIALAEGRYAEAGDLLQASVTTLRGIEQRTELGWALASSAYAARALGDPNSARDFVHAALQAGAGTENFVALMFALPAAALLLADRGETEQAAGLYALAARYPLVGNSRWFDDVAGSVLAEETAALPPEAAAAAAVQGRTRNLEATLAGLLAEFGDLDPSPSPPG